MTTNCDEVEYFCNLLQNFLRELSAVPSEDIWFTIWDIMVYEYGEKQADVLFGLMAVEHIRRGQAEGKFEGIKIL